MTVDLTYHEFILFFLIFVRLATILATVPFYGFAAVPVIGKVGLSALMAVIVFPFVDQSTLLIPTQLWPFVINVMNQVLIGLIIGFAADFLFVAIRYAGTLIGLDMGFGIVNVIDPQSGDQVSIIGQFKFMLAMLLFIVWNGHHFLLEALTMSFEVIPVSNHTLVPEVALHLGAMFGALFITAFKLASATLGSLFLTSLIMGILARTVPQMNIFIVGFPLKISIGFILLFISLPFFGYVFSKAYSQFMGDLLTLIRIL